VRRQINVQRRKATYELLKRYMSADDAANLMNGGVSAAYQYLRERAWVYDTNDGHYRKVDTVMIPVHKSTIDFEYANVVLRINKSRAIDMSNELDQCMSLMGFELQSVDLEDMNKERRPLEMRIVARYARKVVNNG